MADRIRLRQICLMTAALEPAIDTLMEVFGLTVCYGKADLSRYGIAYVPPPPFQAEFFAKHGLVSAQLPIGETFLELVAPTRADTPAGRFLERRGPGGYMVITEVEDTRLYAARIEAEGVRLAGTVDYPTYHELQLDPRDMGAAILSFSMQREGRPFDGGWYPGGPDWQRRAAPGFTAIRVAELAVKAPADVAAKWGAVIGRPVVEQDGIARIGLEGSEIRFVPDVSGRPDRLDSLHIEMDDFRAAQERARAKGLCVEHGGIGCNGVTFKQVSAPWQ
ncbi:hypothetical protein FHS85_004042 [Rhodoligotrophos appendicifer]|uniref:hypothetical protein n=1 Tax=Rhodoligotrophos appendicifer TaxID=987056 RepID=UPI001186F620|nr:hypothetical protein [Rhodoligotrophos appendicifer]